MPINSKFRRALLAIAILLAIWAPVYIISIGDIEREKDGCERLNTVREQLYDTLSIAIDLVQENPQLVAEFQKQQIELVNSVKIYADPFTDNPVDVNCSEAYPKPFPF